MNHAKTAVLERLFDRRPAPEVAAFPAFARRGFAWGVERRSIFAFFSCLIGVSAIIAYVISVNLIFLSGQAMRKDEDLRKVLERDTATLEHTFSQAQSPARLEEKSRLNGMVAVGTLRYVSHDQSLARAR